MPLLNVEQKNQELELIKNFLNELDFPAVILPSGPWGNQDSLLIELPNDQEEAFEAGELPENAYVAIGNLVQLDETDQNQLTKYLVFYFMIPEALDAEKEFEALKIVNEMNQQIRMGSFFYGPSQSADGVQYYMQYRLSIGTSTDEMWDEAVVGEAIIEMGLYYELMNERIQPLLK